MNEHLLKLSRQLVNPPSYFQGITMKNTGLPKELVLFHRQNFPIHRNINYHHRFMLIICLSGRGEYYVDNERRVIKEGECSAILPYQFHRVESLADEYDWLFITFEDQEKQFFNLHGFHEKLTVFQLELLSELLQTYCSVMSKHEMRHIILLVSTLLSSLGKECKSKPLQQYAPEVDSTLVHSITQFIHQHPTESPELEEVSGHFNISVSHLRRIFRNCTGESLGHFIQTCRMNRAMRRLNGTDDSISEVAYHCGYESVPSFCKSFKKHTDLTPSQFRKRLKKNAESRE